MVDIKVNGKVYHVEMVETEEDKERGLQGITELPEDQGMIFCYDDIEDVSFWMAKTLIPLDIIFIDEDYEISKVVEGKPNDETPIIGKQVSYVLEVNAGSGIKPGDDIDLSGLDEEMEEEYEEDEGISEGTSEGLNPTMHVLAENGETQMELNGGERIFSRKNSRTLIHLAKKAYKSKKNVDYKTLGRKVFQYIHTQDTQEQQYTSIK